MEKVKTRLLISLAVSAIIVLAAGNFTGGLAYLERNGHITYPNMTWLGKAAATVRAPGTLAVKEFIAARHAFLAAQEHDQDLQQRYSALSAWLCSTLAAIAAYAACFYSLFMLFSAVRGRSEEPRF